MMYLKISYQIWTNEAVVKTLKLITNVVVSSFSHNVLETRHHVINEALVNSFVHCWLALLGTFDVQNLYERFYGDALKEHCEINHTNCRCHKQGLQFDVSRVDQKHQSKCDRPSQATV